MAIGTRMWRYFPLLSVSFVFSVGQLGTGNREV
jgi:hypothetical protein